MLSFDLAHLLSLGLPLVGVPVLIHVINMMRHRRVQWAAMEFLLVSQKKNRTWVLLKQFLLLLLRMAAIAAIALLVAGPRLRSEFGSVLGSSTTHHVVLLDDSFSMSDRWEDTTAYDEAKKVVERIGKAIGHEGAQTFTLLRFSQAGRGAHGAPDLLQESVDTEFAERLHEKLAGLRCSQTDAGPTPAVEAIEQFLGESDGAERVVYVVSDFRARQWDDPTDLKKHLRELNEARARLLLVNCVGNSRPNLAITSLVPGSGTRAAGVPLFMELTVQNFGPTVVRDVPVLVEADGQALPAVKIVEIPAGKAVKERFQVRFAAPGDHQVTAKLEVDAVAADNFRYAVADFPASVPVLLVDGAAEAQDARYLSAVFASSGPVSTGISPRIEPPRYLAVNPLEPFRAIYVANVDRLDGAAVSALERYVAGGGGVAFFLGERTQTDFFNRELHRGGEGLFPLPLAGPAELLVDRLQRAPDIEAMRPPVHPVFQVFAGDRNSYLPLVIVGRYFAVPREWRPEGDPSVRVLARLRNGAPLAAEKRYGQGRVVAFLTTAGPLWNNWARENPSFPVAMLELQSFLSALPVADVPHLVAAPLEVKLDAAQYEPQVRFVTPREDLNPTATTDATATATGQLLATLAATDVAGIYQARLTRKDGKEEVRRWAYNVAAEEGDLRTLSGEDLASRLQDVKYEYYQAGAFQYNGQRQAGYNLRSAILYMLILLLVVEQILAWSASYHPPSAARTAPAGGAR